MANFQFTTPDGATYRIQAPDEAAALEVLRESGLDPGEAAPAKEMGMGEDLARSAASGLAKGAAGVAATPGMLGTAADWILGQTAGRVENLVKNGTPQAMTVAEMRAKAGTGDRAQRLRGADPTSILSSENTTAAVDRVIDTGYKPQSTAGEYLKTAGEFAPGMLLAPGTVGQRALQTFVPAVVSETAGQATEGSPLEPYARLAGAVAGGVGAGLAVQPRTAQQAVGQALQGVDDAAITRAQAIIQEGAQRGVQVTWDEAIQAASNGATRLSQLRRVVENSPGGGDVLNPMMAQRAGQVQAAGDAAIGGIAPNRLAPSQTGVRVREAAAGTIDDTQAAINRSTRPDYNTVEAARVGQPISGALAGDDIYAATLREVRNDPTLNRTIANLPDDSGAVIDLVQRRMRERADEARMPGTASSSNLRAANLQDARTAPIAAVEQATGGPQGAYARARAAQEFARRNVLEPMSEGPVGRMSRTSDVKTQGSSLLPSAPLPESQRDVANAMRNIAGRDPVAAENLVHSVVRGVFDEATQNLASGPNQFGGAKFAAALTGNSQQARNLETAIRALPNGDQRWQGFRRFLDVMEATGWRPQPGSMTAFNQQLQGELKQGNLVSTLGEGVRTGGTSLVKRVMEFREQANLGQNTAEIARILTDPNSAQLLRVLAQTPPNSRQAQALAARLIFLGYSGKNSGAQSAE